MKDDGLFAAYAAGIRHEADEINAGRVSPRYTCVDCGRSMRIKPRDGFRCDRCLQPWPRVLCRGYETASGARINCANPVIRKGDPGGEVIQGECRVCGEMRRQAEAKRSLREVRFAAKWAREPHEVKKLTEQDWKDITEGGVNEGGIGVSRAVHQGGGPAGQAGAGHHRQRRDGGHRR